jgi:hypothetical protein
MKRRISKLANAESMFQIYLIVRNVLVIDLLDPEFTGRLIKGVLLKAKEKGTEVCNLW